jgi:hypothetical protein
MKTLRKYPKGCWYDFTWDGAYEYPIVPKDLKRYFRKKLNRKNLKEHMLMEKE